jgi:hypothetical protein
MVKTTQLSSVTVCELAQGESEINLLLMSDWHYDSIYCNRELLNKHIKMLDTHNAYGIVAGDIFDAMQGKFDPRRSYSDLRPEYVGLNYYDRITADVTSFVKPYQERIIVLGKGHHDLGVLEHTNSDLISRVVGAMGGTSIMQVGSFAGVVKIKFNRSKTSQKSLTIFYSHGGGSNSPVTKGVIQTARQAVFLPEAHIVHNGHNHQGYILPQPRMRLNQNNEIYTEMQWFVRTPGYKQTGTVGDSWEAQKMFGPSPSGCVLVNVKVTSDESGFRITPTAHIE